MRGLFPGIDTIIIFVAVICAALWGFSRCNGKRSDLLVKTANENPIILDSSVLTIPVSPAASRQPSRLPPRQLPAPVYNAPDPYSTTTIAPSSITPAIPPTRPINPAGYSQPAIVQAPVVVRTPAIQPITVATPSGSILYVLINGLHIHSKPDLHAKSLGKLKLDDEVYFANEVTEKTTPVHLANGEVMVKPWIKIRTKRGTVGWVHGSGVDYYKRKVL